MSIPVHFRQSGVFHDSDAREHLGMSIGGNLEQLQNRWNGRVVQPDRATRTHTPLRMQVREHVDDLDVLRPDLDDLGLDVFRRKAECGELIGGRRTPVQLARRRDQFPRR
jgi:hypothetical protein